MLSRAAALRMTKHRVPSILASFPWHPRREEDKQHQDRQNRDGYEQRTAHRRDRIGALLLARQRYKRKRLGDDRQLVLGLELEIGQVRLVAHDRAERNG